MTPSDIYDALAPTEAREQAAVKASTLPITATEIAADLHALGLAAGDVLLVHSQLSQLGGWLVGGELAVVDALLEILSPRGTLVVPTHTGGNSEPALWSRPSVPEAWWPVIRASTPAFDPQRTPSRMIGRLAEAVRTHPGAHRSDHPVVSMAAIGPQAKAIAAEHPLDHMFGDRSPLGRLYDADAKILLMAVGYDKCTAMHLGEARSRVQSAQRTEHSCAVLRDGARAWVTYTDLATDPDVFPEIGAAFEAAHPSLVRRGGRHACLKLMPLRPLVDFTATWLDRDLH